MTRATFNISDDACRSFPLDTIDATDPAELLSSSNIRKELPLMRCSYVLARQYGGPITQAVLDTIALRTREIYDARIDVRRHFIRPGQVQSLDTGWHCEFPIMHGTLHTFDRVRDLATHNYMLISGPPETEFIDEEIEFDLSEYAPQLIHRLLQQRESPLKTRLVKPGVVNVYNATSLHRARPHHGDQPVWRYLFRATYFLPDDPMGAFENVVGEQIEPRRVL